jgi:hypothetical protein
VSCEVQERPYQHGQANELVRRGLPAALRVDKLAVLLHHLVQRLLDLVRGRGRGRDRG